MIRWPFQCVLADSMRSLVHVCIYFFFVLHLFTFNGCKPDACFLVADNPRVHFNLSLLGTVWVFEGILKNLNLSNILSVRQNVTKCTLWLGNDSNKTTCLTLSGSLLTFTFLAVPFTNSTFHFTVQVLIKSSNNLSPFSLTVLQKVRYTLHLMTNVCSDIFHGNKLSFLITCCFYLFIYFFD